MKRKTKNNMEQKHHVTYIIKYKQFGEIKEKEIVARLLSDALASFLKECIEEDNTGIFFELADADINYFKKKRKFHIVNDNYGIVLEDVAIKTPFRNKYLCELRAKRELLGFNLEEFACEIGMNPGSYTAKEEGHRKMSLDEYAACRKILDLYEEIG